jgi:hypothetical protein
VSSTETMEFGQAIEANVNSTRSRSDVATSESSERTVEQPAGSPIPPDRWFDAVDEAYVFQQREVAARRRAYEGKVHALWRDMKLALAKMMAAYNECHDDSIDCGETPTGDFAATRFRKPLALVDVALDSDNGVIACIYSFGTDRQSPYQESVRILQIRKSETGVGLTTQEGRCIDTCEDAAQDLLTPFITGLTRDVTARTAN